MQAIENADDIRYEVIKFVLSRLLRSDFELDRLSPSDRSILESYERNYPAYFNEAYDFAMEHSKELRTDGEEEDSSREMAFTLKGDSHSDDGDRVDISTKRVRDILGFEDDELHIAEIRGDSMRGIGIKNGDIAIYRQLKEIPKTDTIVIAEVGGVHFIKNLQYIDNTVYLVSENPSYPPVNVEESRNVKIVGEVLANITLFKK